MRTEVLGDLETGGDVDVFECKAALLVEGEGD